MFLKTQYQNFGTDLDIFRLNTLEYQTKFLLNSQITFLLKPENLLILLKLWAILFFLFSLSQNKMSLMALISLYLVIISWALNLKRYSVINCHFLKILFVFAITAKFFYIFLPLSPLIKTVSNQIFRNLPPPPITKLIGPHIYLAPKGTCFFYNQHFYKQHQAEIGKKLSKC